MSTDTEQTRRPPPSEHASGEADAWLARPSTIRLLWWVFAAVLALSVAAQLVVKVKGYFGVDGWFAFGAVYGFLACFAMVVFAKFLGRFLKRDEEYYGTDEDD
jgi:hypothetical protein